MPCMGWVAAIRGARPACQRSTVARTPGASSQLTPKFGGSKIHRAPSEVASRSTDAHRTDAGISGKTNSVARAQHATARRFARIAESRLGTELIILNWHTPYYKSSAPGRRLTELSAFEDEITGNSVRESNRRSRHTWRFRQWLITTGNDPTSANCIDSTESPKRDVRKA
jgi:hypothetical protein